jgi:hypothetical protein
MNELPMIQGWPFVAWATENDAFTTASRSGAGYVYQGARQIADRNQP